MFYFKASISAYVCCVVSRSLIHYYQMLLSGIRDYIISRSMCVCGATNILADDLLPNKTLRDTINRISESNNSSGENGGSALQVQGLYDITEWYILRLLSALFYSVSFDYFTWKRTGFLGIIVHGKVWLKKGVPWKFIL